MSGFRASWWAASEGVDDDEMAAAVEIEAEGYNAAFPAFEDTDLTKMSVIIDLESIDGSTDRTINRSIDCSMYCSIDQSFPPLIDPLK